MAAGTPAPLFFRGKGVGVAVSVFVGEAVKVGELVGVGVKVTVAVSVGVAVGVHVKTGVEAICVCWAAAVPVCSEIRVTRFPKSNKVFRPNARPIPPNNTPTMMRGR